MAQTLDQQRAAFAWTYAKEGMRSQEAKEYKALVKGAPALIMNSGLMPTLAYYADKGSDRNGISIEKAAGLILTHLMAGLSERLKPAPRPDDFKRFMELLHKVPSQQYLRYTDEALELLKWIRQFVDAVEQGGH